MKIELGVKMSLLGKETIKELMARDGKGLSKATSRGNRKRRTNLSHVREAWLLGLGFLIGCYSDSLRYITSRLLMCTVE